MAYGYNLEAVYADGYVHSERALNDQSPYVPRRNVFYDICKRLPESDHGRLVRFSALNDGTRPADDCRCYGRHIDFSAFPANAKPIYYRHMERQVSVGGLSGKRWNWLV